MILTLLIISLFGGFLSGFLGLGGAVIIIPLMITVPPLLGMEALSMKTVAGLSMIQVLAASFSSLIIHKQNRFVHWQTLYYVGVPMALFALSGAYFSQYMNDQTIMILFGCLLVAAFLLLFFHVPQQTLDHKTDDIHIHPGILIVTGMGIGTISGIVGAGGGFILVPIMIVLLKIPVKMTVGTSLGIVCMGAIFGAAGKILSLQVDYKLAIPVIIGSLTAARFGAKFCKIVPEKLIRRALLVVLFLSILQIGYKLL